MSSWTSYPSIFSLGHKAIKGILSVKVQVEEKVDGSQFSFGLVPASPADIVYKQIDGKDYALKIRSKGCVMHIDAPEKMFNKAAETVKSLADQLTPGWTYRSEYLQSPSHNSLIYDRVPARNIIIFDINTDHEEYLDYYGKAAEAARLGLETVPLLFTGRIHNIEDFRKFLDTTSVLGGQKIEGVVIKPLGYGLYGQDKKVLLGKFVSETFKEVHRQKWGNSNPGQGDIILTLSDMYSSQARWQKALVHLKEEGKIVDDPHDIPALINAIPLDIEKEEKEEIKEYLWRWAWPHLRRNCTKGVAYWYKDLLLRKSFEDAADFRAEVGPESVSDNSSDTANSDSGDSISEK